MNVLFFLCFNPFGPTHSDKHENIMKPPLCLSVQTTSDWGCCFLSCLLYKLIWPETFALLGAKRDVMSADTSWRPSRLLTPGALVESGAPPHSLQLPKYHLTIFWQEEEQHEMRNKETFVFKDRNVTLCHMQPQKKCVSSHRNKYISIRLHRSVTHQKNNEEHQRFAECTGSVFQL